MTSENVSMMLIFNVIAPKMTTVMAVSPVTFVSLMGLFSVIKHGCGANSFNYVTLLASFLLHDTRLASALFCDSRLSSS